MNLKEKLLYEYGGIPYVWGGESIKEGGFDCSGFVYRVITDLCKKSIPRLTAQGYRELYRTAGSYGTVVNSAPIGSLIFYGSVGRASHVAILVEDGAIIESGGGGSENTYENPGAGVREKSWYYRPDIVEITWSPLVDIAKGDGDMLNRYIMSLIKYGSSGEDVELFQLCMKSRGFYTGEIDRVYGEKCVSACRKIQEYANLNGCMLEIDGECGRDTWPWVTGKHFN